MTIERRDRTALRELAKLQAELAASERNQRLFKDWLDYGAGRLPGRMMIRIEIDTFENDVLPPLMKCEGPEAREIEKRMLRPIANHILFGDDTLVPPHYPVFDRFSFIPFGIKPRRQGTGGLGHRFIPYLRDLAEDGHLLGPSLFHVDGAGSLQEQADMEDLLGDLLPVKRVSNCLGCSPTQDIIHIMDMQDMYVAMADDRSRFHSVMRRLTDDYLAFFRMIEKGGYARSAAKAQHLNQGSYCFTDELPDDMPGAKLKDLWLYIDSQETSGVSPAMYEELVFPYYKEIMDAFGLISYGCCEATHPLWEGCLSKVPNLRKVSVSPWCDEEFMGERLRGTDITFLRKPPATLLGVNPELDEAAVKGCFEKTARAARGCKVEIAQRDVYAIRNTPDKVKRYVSLARRAFEENWA